MTAHPIDTDALRELAEKATPGERRTNGMAVENEYGGGRIVRGHEWDGFTAVIEEGHTEDDPAFLAATDPGTILALLDALERAESERDEARSQVRLLDAANDEEIDARDAAEHRAARAEAQSEARRINTEYWKGVARGNAITADVWKESAEEAQTRIKAVEDVARAWETSPGRPEVVTICLAAAASVRRALSA